VSAAASQAPTRAVEQQTGNEERVASSTRTRGASREGSRIPRAARAARLRFGERARAPLRIAPGRPFARARATRRLSSSGTSSPMAT
jgi:hypothetical protein